MLLGVLRAQVQNDLGSSPLQREKEFAAFVKQHFGYGFVDRRYGNTFIMVPSFVPEPAGKFSMAVR